jgi:hypothetical protein
MTRVPRPSLGDRWRPRQTPLVLLLAAGLSPDNTSARGLWPPVDAQDAVISIQVAK